MKSDYAIRVLYILNDAAGGASMSLWQMLRVLPRKQISPYVVAPPPRQDPESLKRFDALSEGVYPLHMPWWNLYSDRNVIYRYLAYANALRINRFYSKTVLPLMRLIRQQKIDIVHTNTSVTIDGAFAAKLTGTPHVWHIREYLGPGSNFQFPIPRPLLGPVFFSMADRVVCNSTPTLRAIRNVRHAEKGVVIHNAVDLDELKDPDAANRGKVLRKQLALPDDAFVIAMVGSLMAKCKRHDLFVEVAARIAKKLPHTRFVVYGMLPLPGSRHWPYWEQIKRQIAAYDLTDKLVFAGFQNDIPAMMHSMDLMIHPAIFEGFGRALVEAMAVRKPVIAFRSSGPTDIVHHGKTGYLISPVNLDQMAKAACSLVKDKTKRDHLGTQAQQIAFTQFSNERLANELLQLYQNTITRKQ